MSEVSIEMDSVIVFIINLSLAFTETMFTVSFRPNLKPNPIVSNDLNSFVIPTMNPNPIYSTVPNVSVMIILNSLSLSLACTT